MKKIITKIGMVALTIVAALVFNGCKGDKGDIGNSGPAGAAGAAGPTGADGNANVHSLSFVITSGNWLLNGSTAYVDLTDSQITSDIVNSGAVLVYGKSTGATFQLPYTFSPSTAYSETMTAIHDIGYVEIRVNDSNLLIPPNPGYFTFKVVVMTSKMLLTNPHINFKDFESVKKAYNLK